MARKARSSGVSRKAGGGKAARQRDYKAEYARRIARGLAAGKTRQQARGKATPMGITEAQLKRLRAAEKVQAFAQAQAAKFVGTDAGTVAEIVAALTEKIREQGMSYLNRLQAEIARMHREYMSQTKRDKRGRRPSVGYNLDTLSETWQLPPETFGYH